MPSKNSSVDDGGGGLVKKLLFPSFVDSGPNENFLAPANQKSHQKQDDENSSQSQTGSTAPPKSHKVEYDGSQVGGYAPSDTPKSALSPLEPQKLLTEHSASTGLNTSLNTSVDLSRDMSMIVNTGACAEKQIVEDTNVASESFNIAENSIIEEDEAVDDHIVIEEEKGGEEEDEFINSMKNLASPTFGTVHETSGNASTPIGTTILSPPIMSRHTQIHDDSNSLSYNDDSTNRQAISFALEGEMAIQTSSADTDGSLAIDMSPIHKPSVSNLFRTQSYGEHSEAPSSLLGCSFLSNGAKLFDGVTKQSETQLDKVYDEDRQDKLVSNKCMVDNGGEHNGLGSTGNDQIENDTAADTAEIASKFDRAERKYCLNNNDDDSSVDADSLVSEYGSDIGDLKVRLDDVYAMDAVEEEEEEDEELPSVENKNQGGKYHTKSDLKLSPLQDLQNDPQISFSEEDYNKENCVNRSTRVISPNLVWSNDGVEMESGMANRKDSSKGKCNSVSTKTDMHSPASPVQRDSNSSTTPTTPIAAVSAAFRRIGNGVSSITRGSKSPSNSDSILNVEGLDSKSSRKSEGVSLSPRLGFISFRRTKSTEESNISSPRRIMQSMRNQISSPLHHARSGCLSFVPESGIPPYANMLSINDSPPASPILIPKRSEFHSHSTGHSPRLRFKSQSWEVGSNRTRDNQCDRITDIDIDMDRRKTTQHEPGSNLFSGLSATSTGAAFRNNGTSILIREGQPFQPAISSSRRRQFVNSLGHLGEEEREETVPTRENSYPPVLLQSPQRVGGDIEKEDALDILALLVERSVAFHEKTDQSSGVAIDDESVDNDWIGQSDSLQPSQCQDDVPPLAITNSTETAQNKKISVQMQTQPCLSSSVSDIQDSIEELRTISKNHGDGSTMTTNHVTRMGALDELQRSYTYALEMKRAALSASTWLRAIGRSNKNDEHNSTANLFINKTVSTTSINGVATEKALKHQHSACALNISDSMIDERMKMNPDALRLALHTDQLKITAKDELNKRLDHELSVCRAEIGRLKSVSRSETTFVSPNRSILDEDGDDDSSASSNKEEFLETSGTDISFLECSDAKDISVSRDLSTSQALSSIVESKRELLLMKAELAQANKKVKSMEDDMEKLQQQQLSGQNTSSVERAEVVAENTIKEVESCEKRTEKDSLLTEDDVAGSVEDDQRTLSSESCVGVIPFSDNLLKKDLDNYVEAIRKADKTEIEFLNGRLEEANKTKEDERKPDEKMINVRMLDGENFVTEWNKLGPLPPPPDHDLHSPIVTALLSQWTDDCLTREALISWMEKLIEGVDPNSVPPLKLSSLDHQVRDGFTMHVLPLLLRRSDLYLEVTSRAQRRTSYDIIATVKSPHTVLDGSLPLKSHDGTSLTGPNLRNHVSGSHMMAFKASGGIDGINDSAEECASPHDKFKVSSQGTGRSDVMESGSVTHSSITEYVSNQIVKSPYLENRVRAENVRPSETSVDSKSASNNSTVGSSRSDSSTQKNQPSIMAGAMNAVGGLLSRRKLHQSPCSSRRAIEEDTQHESPKQHHTPGSVLLPTLGKSPMSKFRNPFPILSSSTSARGRADLPKPSTLIENETEDQPYHRVVNAPPGRIGMTFVQYRGHAIISDVYPNSPLQGLVFPSDILIAIDEVPVSGKRVLEIVKLLNARKERQRALRVISSHAMTDLMITQNSAASIDG